MSIVYFDGQFLPEAEAKIPITNRGFLFGDGVYATIQVNEGKPLFLATHLERLKTQAKGFGLQVTDIQELIIKQLIEKNQATTGIWKLKVIVCGDDDPQMRLPSRHAKHLIMLLHPFTPAPYTGLKVAQFPTPVMTAHTSFKSLAHLSRYFVMEYGLSHGCDDGFTTTEQGILLECAFGNLFWVHDNQLFTPDPALPLHFGVTISNMIEIAHKLKWGVKLVKFKLADIPEGAFLFRCNTMSGIRPIEKMAHRTFTRDFSLEEKLQDRYCDLAGIKRSGSLHL